jgi:iron complex transport system permease protein
MRRFVWCFVGLGVILIGFTVLNVVVGSVRVPLGQLPAILFSDTSQASGQILWSIRLPRLCAALILGGALGLAGFLLQTFFANPIAGPFILGISSGAKLVVALVTVFALSKGRMVGSGTMVAGAFIGALAAMGLVMALASRVRSAGMLIVAGVMIGYICSAITDFIINFAEDSSIANLHNWSLGSFSATSWGDVSVMALIVGAAGLCSFALAKPIAAFQLGEQYAQNMGVNVTVFRIWLVVLSSLLAATVTAFAGPISFVGVAVPHLVRALFGTSKPIVVMPGCFLGGAAFCLGCDLLARTMFAPLEINISSITAAFGAPIVIFVMLRRR